MVMSAFSLCQLFSSLHWCIRNLVIDYSQQIIQRWIIHPAIHDKLNQWQFLSRNKRLLVVFWISSCYVIRRSNTTYWSRMYYKLTSLQSVEIHRPERVRKKPKFYNVCQMGIKLFFAEKHTIRLNDNLHFHPPLCNKVCSSGVFFRWSDTQLVLSAASSHRVSANTTAAIKVKRH
jgi:hypothetical protein